MKISKWHLPVLLAAFAGTAGAQEPAFFTIPPYEMATKHDGFQQHFGRVVEQAEARREPVARHNERESPRAEAGFFYDELEPYGDWVTTRAYGWAWRPGGVGRDWRPYSQGRWVLTDHGFTWASSEPFGWATYHYGRWARDARQGWLWVPGILWGPAWVSWRIGGGFVGWAPLAPSVGFAAERGIGGDGSSAGTAKSEHYVFVPANYFLEPNLGAYLAPRIRNHQILGGTADATRYAFSEERVLNQGLESELVAELAGRQPVALQVMDAGSKQLAEVGERELTVYRPEPAQLATVGCGRRNDAGRGAALGQP